jgi:hypothetical protein
MAKKAADKTKLREIVAKIRSASHPSQDAMRDLVLTLAEHVDPECVEVQDGKEDAE